MIRQGPVRLNRLGFLPHTSHKVPCTEPAREGVTATDSSYPTGWAVVNKPPGKYDRCPIPCLPPREFNGAPTRGSPLGSWKVGSFRMFVMGPLTGRIRADRSESADQDPHQTGHCARRRQTDPLEARARDGGLAAEPDHRGTSPVDGPVNRWRTRSPARRSRRGGRSSRAPPSRVGAGRWAGKHSPTLRSPQPEAVSGPGRIGVGPVDANGGTPMRSGRGSSQTAESQLDSSS